MSFKNRSAGHEVKEQNDGLVNNLYGRIDQNSMEEAGYMLNHVFRTKGAKQAKRFYQWLHEETKMFLKQHQDYRSCAMLMENTEYLHEQEAITLRQSLLEEIARCFESGKYKKSRLKADRFIRNYKDNLTDLNHRLYGPFMAVVRKSARKAARAARVFQGYGYENWLNSYLQSSNNKINKARRRE